MKMFWTNDLHFKLEEEFKKGKKQIGGTNHKMNTFFTSDTHFRAQEHH
jgi:hypothetical protein